MPKIIYLKCLSVVCGLYFYTSRKHEMYINTLFVECGLFLTSRKATYDAIVKNAFVNKSALSSSVFTLIF